MNDSIITNRSVLATLAMHQLADQLTPPQTAVPVTRRWGTIMAIHSNTVDVAVGAVTLTGISYLAWYIPTVGDTVAVDVVGPDVAVVGTTSLATSPQAGVMLAAATSAKTPSTLVERDANGISAFVSVNVDTQTLPGHATRKDYVDAGGRYLGSGTAFPSTPNTSDRFKRTDVGTNGSLFFWNGTSWLQMAQTVKFTNYTAITNSPYVYAGFAALDNSTGLVWRYNGTKWALFYTPPDTDWTYVGGTGGPAFANGWANYNGGFPPARFRKLQNNQVEVQGLVAGGTLAAAMFTLPAGYRPGYSLITTQNGHDGFARVDFQSSGVVICQGAASGTQWVSIGYTFYAEG